MLRSFSTPGADSSNSGPFEDGNSPGTLHDHPFRDACVATRWVGSFTSCGHRHRRDGDSSDSGTTTIGDIWTLAGEGDAFGEEGVSKVGKDFAESYDPFRRQSLATKLFITNV